MAKRSKKEVINFLNSQVGKMVRTKPSGRLDGQCVTLIKALFEFLGVPNPYGARGNAKDAGNIYLAQNIAEKGKGELTICINKDMGLIGGVRYGHIWIHLKGVANYEQNGAKALLTTKNTRPISQGQQFVNLDKWIKKSGTIDDMTKPTKAEVGNMFNYAGVADKDVPAKTYKHYMARDWKVLGKDIAKKLYGQKKTLQEKLKNAGDPTSNDPQVRQSLKDKIIKLIKGA